MDELVAFDPSSSLTYTRTDQECYVEDCDGILWSSGSALVCQQCSSMTESSQTAGTILSQEYKWENFRHNRETYHNSGRPKMVGGFLDPYEWVTEDILGNYEADTVSGVDPESFYTG
jgi:hypothetical protein